MLDRHQGKAAQVGTSPSTMPSSNPCKGKNSPTFKGVGDEAIDRFWFIEESIWNAQNINNDVIKRV